MGHKIHSYRPSKAEKALPLLGRIERSRCRTALQRNATIQKNLEKAINGRSGLAEQRTICLQRHRTDQRTLTNELRNLNFDPNEQIRRENSFVQLIQREKAIQMDLFQRATHF